MAYQVRKNAQGLLNNVNKFNAPPGALASVDNGVINADDQIERRAGYDKCATGLPAAKPLKLFTHNGTLYTHINDSLYYKDSACVYSKMKFANKVFISPKNFATDGAGTFFAVQDASFVQDYHDVRGIYVGADVVNLVAGTPFSSTVFPTGVNGTRYAARFSAPTDLVVAGSGDPNYGVFVCDSGECDVRRIDFSGYNVSTFAGVIGTGGNVDGIGAAARFISPQGICADDTYLWILDVVSFFTAGFPGTNSRFKRIQISNADVVTINGAVRAGDPFANTIYFIRDGWTEQGHGYCYFIAGSDGSYGASTFLGSAGFSILQINKTTGAVVDFSGNWNARGTVTGTAANTRFYQPYSIIGSVAKGYLWVSDRGAIIRVSLADGSTTVYAGAYNTYGIVDGIGTNARFSSNDIILSFYNANTLFVADSATIRTIDIDTAAVSTYARIDGFGYDGALNPKLIGPT